MLFRGSLLAIGLLLAPMAAHAQTAPAAAPKAGEAAKATDTFKPLAMDRNGVLILLRSVLFAVQQANDTGNYSVLRELGAPGFQAANSSARLAEIFAALRSQNVDLSGVAVLEPQLTRLPEINDQGYMRMAGYFPSAPLQVNFDLVFAAHAGRWRHFGIAINLGPSSPMVPAPPPSAFPAKPAATPPQSKPTGQ